MPNRVHPDGHRADMAFLLSHQALQMILLAVIAECDKIGAARSRAH